MREGVGQFHEHVAKTETVVADGCALFKRRRREERETLLRKFRELKGQQKFARKETLVLLAVNEPFARTREQDGVRASGKPSAPICKL